MQLSFRFVAKRRKWLANGTLAKRPVALSGMSLFKFRQLANKRKWTENESLLIDKFGGIVCLLALHLSSIEYSKLINGPTAAAANGALDAEVRVHW